MKAYYAPQNNPAVRKHFKPQVKTLLQNATRDDDKLEALFKAKETKEDKAAE
jgi:hypothetical protein